MAIGRVLSGMRPTGKLHLGHYRGVLSNWLKLQSEYECFFFVADWHALTTDYESPKGIKENVREMVLDWLSVGIDAEKATIFRQSHVKEHAELYLLLAMITPLSWLERNPTYKEQLAEIRDKDLHNLGFLGYPVLQTADIIAYKANKVPVGIDQVPHIELSREITRRFNNFYGEVFPEPETLLTSVPKILGTDGRKMSKSYNNAVFLTDEPKAIEQKILQMVTDVARKRRTDPGNPDVCPFYVTYHNLYSNDAEIAFVREGCTTASIGCIECKRTVIPKLLADLEPIQARRREFERAPEIVEAILNNGSNHAREVAQVTMDEVRRAMGLE